MNDNERMEIESRMYFDNVGAYWGAFVYRFTDDTPTLYPQSEGTLSQVYKWSEDTVNDDSGVHYILIHPWFDGVFERDSPLSHCVIGGGAPEAMAARLKRDFIVYIHATDATHVVGVLPFDDTPLPMTIEQQIDAAIAKHALTVKSECECELASSGDYYALAAEMDEVESEIEAWRDFAVKLTNAPRCMVETPYEAQSWLDLKGLIR